MRYGADRATREPSDRWRDIHGYEGIYRVSDLGAVYSCRSSRLLHPHADADGYLRIGLWDGDRQKKFAVHKLVAEAFHGERRNALHNEVAHLDGNRANPRADNLKWVSKVENRSHRKLHGTECCGEAHGAAKLTNAQAREIRGLRGKVRQGDLASQYGVSVYTIHDIMRGRRYASVTECHGYGARQ
jgi:hypothetical protein